MGAISSFIREAKTNFEYDQVVDSQRAANPKCSVCNTAFQLKDRVHELACHHVFHRSCIKPLLESGVLYRNQVEEDQDPQEVSLKELNLALERRCPIRDCGEPIGLDDKNIKKAFRLISDFQRFPRNFKQRKVDLDLMAEYLETFGPEKNEDFSKDQERDEKCQRVANSIATVAGILLGSFVGYNWFS